MFRHGARTFATCARRMAEAPSAYTITVSKAQGIAHGLVGGMPCLYLLNRMGFKVTHT